MGEILGNSWIISNIKSILSSGFIMDLIINDNEILKNNTAINHNTGILGDGLGIN